MASIAGNKRNYNKHTLGVKYAALIEIDQGLSSKDVSKNSMSQKTPCQRGKRPGKK